MCYCNKKKQGWTEAIALKDTKVFGWTKKTTFGTKMYALNWTKIDSFNRNIHLLNTATISLPYYGLLLWMSFLFFKNFPKKRWHSSTTNRGCMSLSVYMYQLEHGRHVARLHCYRHRHAYAATTIPLAMITMWKWINGFPLLILPIWVWSYALSPFGLLELRYYSICACKFY